MRYSDHGITKLYVFLRFQLNEVAASFFHFYIFFLREVFVHALQLLRATEYDFIRMRLLHTMIFFVVICFHERKVLIHTLQRPRH